MTRRPNRRKRPAFPVNAAKLRAALERAQQQPPEPRRAAPANPQATPVVKRSTKRRR